MTTLNKIRINSWLGTKKVKNSVENEGQNANFFTNTDVLTGQSSLIRESIQNAIDARDKTNGKIIARVRFYVGKVPSDIAKKYFATQYLRISKCLTMLPNLEDKCSFISIEDFETTGLLGSVNSDLPEGDPRIQSFFYFTWATGKSNKKTGTGGKNGVGKIVFPKTSLIRSFLVFSSRDNSNVPEEGQNLLFGTSILKTHELEGSKWLPESHWMVEDDDGNHIPSSNEDAIREFCQDWKLKRDLEVRGTSIVIPYCDEKFTGQTLAQCVAQDYFAAILEGFVEVEVVDEDGYSVVLNALNITQNLEGLDPSLMTRNSKSKEELLALCDLYKERKNSIAKVFMSRGKTMRRNFWDEHEITEENRESSRDELESGNSIVFEIETHVPRTTVGAPASEDRFYVLIKKSEGTNLPTTFAREGILIPSANSSRIDGYLTLVIIDGGRLADLLGDAEGPSHEKWSWDEEKFHGKYSPMIAGEETIQFVRQSVVKILRKIQIQSNEFDDMRYANAFPVPTSNGAKPIDGVLPTLPGGAKKPRKKKSKRKRAKGTNLPLVADNFMVEKTSSGFKIIPAGTNSLKIGDKILIKAGYALSSGNPLSKSKVDFALAKNFSKSASTGVKLVGKDANFVTLQVENLAFVGNFESFDTYRDLVVAVNDVN